MDKRLSIKLQIKFLSVHKTIDASNISLVIFFQQNRVISFVKPQWIDAQPLYHRKMLICRHFSGYKLPSREMRM